MTLQLPRLPKRSYPDKRKVEKLRKRLALLKGATPNQQLFIIFTETDSWEDGYNIATLTMAFFPEEIEIIDGEEYPTQLAQYKMRKLLRKFHVWEDAPMMAAYSKTNKEQNSLDHRYYNMLTIEDLTIIEQIDNNVIKALKQCIKKLIFISRINPNVRNADNSEMAARIKYDLKIRKKMLRALEKSEGKDGEDKENENDAE